MSEYWTVLTEKVRRWKLKHPAEYDALEAEIRTSLLLPPLPAELPSSRRMVVDGAITETIRKQEGWPTASEYQATQVPTVRIPPEAA